MMTRQVEDKSIESFAVLQVDRVEFKKTEVTILAKELKLDAGRMYSQGSESMPLRKSLSGP